MLIAVLKCILLFDCCVINYVNQLSLSFHSSLNIYTSSKEIFYLDLDSHLALLQAKCKNYSI